MCHIKYFFNKIIYIYSWKYLETIVELQNNFLERTMSLLLSLTGSEDDMFSPSCTLFIYKCFHVIDMLTKGCHDVSHFLLEKYRVDFRLSYAYLSIQYKHIAIQLTSFSDCSINQYFNF